MIFKTFDSDIDKISSKWGMFGRSFDSIGTAITGRVRDVSQEFQSTKNFAGALRSSDSIWKRLYPGRESIQQQLIDVDALYPKISEDNAENWIITLNNIDKQVKNGTMSWQDYFNGLDDNKRWIAKWGQETEGQIRTTEDLIRANDAARNSALDQNRALKAQTLSARAGKVAMQALATVGNMLAGYLISRGIQAAATAIDNYVHRVEKANDAMDDAVSAYSSAKSGLDSINSELDEHMQKISELEAKDKLTYAEKGQLDELKAITDELLLQQSISEKRTDKASREAADKTVDAYETQYGKYDISREGVEQRFQYNDFSAPRSEDDITGYIASYVSVNSALEDAKEQRRNILNADADADVTSLDEEIQDYIDATVLYSEQLDSSISDLQEKRLALEDEYQKAIEKKQNGGEMTTSESRIIDTYNAITDNLKTIYEFTDPEEWNSMEISGIFSITDIEKTREELIKLEKAGELSPEVLESYPKLGRAISESSLIVSEGSTAFQTAYDEIAKLAAKQEELSNSISSETKPYTGIAETVDRLNTQLKPAFDTIQTAWESIFTDDGFTLDNVDLSMLDSIRDSIDKINKTEEIDISYESFETLAKILTDTTSTEAEVINGLNRFITEIVNGSTALDGMNASNAHLVQTMLESLGVTNAQEIVYDSLVNKTDALALKEQLLSETGSTLKSVTNEQVINFLAQAGASDAAKNHLINLISEEQVFSNQKLDVSGKILKLKELAETYGQTALAAKIAAHEKANEDGHTVGSWSEADLKAFQEEWNKGLGSITVDLSGINMNIPTTTSGKGTGRDSHLEEYQKKLSDLQNMLDQELINEKEFYGQSDALLNEYLKDTPAHMQKYADEISGAEKTLRGNWTGSFGYEKAQLEKDLNDNVLVQWQYYERLSELAEKYYNTEGVSYGKFADEYDEITREIKEGQEKLWDDIFGEINTQLDGLQSACETVGDAITEYSESGSLSIDTMQKLIALEPQYMAMLLDENGQLQLNAEAYERLAETKLEELKIALANQALDTISGLQDEAQAVELLTGKYAGLRDTSLGAVEARIQAAVEEAHGRGEKQGQAADMMMQAYQNQKNIIDMTSLSLPSPADSGNDKTEREFLKTFDWIGTLLEKISDKTSKLVDKVDKFHSWQKKNSMINRAVKAADREISQNERAYQAYMKKANSAGLSASYINKIQNGTLSIQDVTSESLSNRIDTYQEWYDKAQACLETVEDLYDRQRDLIRQKLDNVLDYYSDMDSYLSSITSKIESVISLNDGMGKRSSLTELVEQFAGISGQLENAGTGKTTAAAAQAGTGTEGQTEPDRIQDRIDSIQTDLEDSATYRNLSDKISKTKTQLAGFDETGYDNLTRGQKKTYDKLQKQLEAYYAQKASLDENATAANIAEYNKTYLAWKKLQDRLDSSKNLSENQWKQYNSYTKQLKGYADEKADTISELKDVLADAQNPGDKLEQIEKTYEASREGIRESYQNQIDSISGEAENTRQYQNLSAKAQKLEQKKAARGLSKSEQANLDRYNAELEALQTGATGSNITSYMKTWESWYKLQKKLDDGKKLSDSEAKKYDTYQAQLEAWNDEKQTQINDLLSLMEDDLGQLQKTYTENVSEAESQTNDYYANLYSLAKQIAEYSLTSLQDQLAATESLISYYKELASLYDSFSGDKLVKLFTDLGEIDEGNAISGRMELYGDYLGKLQEKYDLTLSEINEYEQLLGALETGDFEASMELFDKAMKGYREEGNTEMAERLQSVLDLLNERAIDADNWSEFADEWANEWEEKFSAAKQDLIGIAAEIQEVNDALREISFEHITDAIEELDRASGILSSIESLIQDDWLFEPDGTLSEYGQAKAALLVSQLEDAQAQANEYLNLYNRIQENRDTYASDKAYQSALNDAQQNYYQSLNNAASLENSIMDLMKKAAEEEVNGLKDIIEARKKALQSKKEYYDYDKSIRNSQKEIDTIRAQIDALESLSGATDAATKAKLAQLRAELSEKEDALQETKDEHTFNLQINALDEFADSLTNALDSSSKSVEEILKEQKEIVDSAKELYQISSESSGNTLDRLTAFYSAMGVSIDGTPAISETQTAYSSDTATGTVALPANKNINAGADNIVSAVNETTGTVEILKQETIDKLAALITNQELLLETIPTVFPWESVIIPRLNEGISQLSEFIQTREETQPVVINNHYDSLMNVEGNVDKAVADLLPRQLQQSYEYTTQRLSTDLSLVGGMKCIRKSVIV